MRPFLERHGRVYSRVIAAGLLATAALMTGCAMAPTAPAALTPSPSPAAKTQPQSVSVAASGFNAHGTASMHLSDATVTDALATAIEQNKLFSRVLKSTGGDYQLSVILVDAIYPKWGSTFTVSVEMAWQLKRADGTSVWRESVKTEGVATGTEAFVGAERVRLAGERAVRENIVQGLARLSKAPI